MDESTRSRYADLLREGRTEEATSLVQEEVDVSVQDVADPVSKFADRLNGVGEELAEEFVEEFGDWESFEQEAGKDRLVDISGVGESRAENLLEQVG